MYPYFTTVFKRQNHLFTSAPQNLITCSLAIMPPFQLSIMPRSPSFVHFNTQTSTLPQANNEPTMTNIVLHAPLSQHIKRTKTNNQWRQRQTSHTIALLGFHLFPNGFSSPLLPSFHSFTYLSQAGATQLIITQASHNKHRYHAKYQYTKQQHQAWAAHNPAPDARMHHFAIRVTKSLIHALAMGKTRTRRRR